jgi:hypothetical protein
MTDKESIPPPSLTPDQERRLAVDLFNGVWDLIVKQDRTIEDDDRMVHAAHASRYHWGNVGQPVNFGRGEWQISRVYVLLGRAEPALHHAQRYLQICEGNGIADWDIAFAHEAVARACAAAGDRTGYAEHYRLAEAAGALIAETEEREYFFSDLANEPWFGMRP